MKIRKEIVPNFIVVILILFFIQLTSFLVESIYSQSIIQFQPSIETLGILLLYIPLILIPFKLKRGLSLTLFISILVCVGLTLGINTPYQIYSSGLGAGFILFYILSQKFSSRVDMGVSVALATLISILFRVIGNSVDISFVGDGKIVSWILLILCLTLYQAQKTPGKVNKESVTYLPMRINFFYILGLISNLIFIYAVFSSPTILSRWVEGNNTMIHIVLVLSILSFICSNSSLYKKIFRSNKLLILWNLLFIGSFLLTILSHRIEFPTQNSGAVTVCKPTVFQSYIVYVMLLLSPVIYINIRVFSSSVKIQVNRQLFFPYFVSISFFILFIFSLIYTNSWGYAGNYSAILRNQFHMPFLLIGIFSFFPYLFSQPNVKTKKNNLIFPFLGLVLSLLIILNVGSTGSIAINSPNAKKLKLMTYNIQQGIDKFGNKNFQAQLKLIQKINPDVICLQESDGVRISGGNSDVVRYFSEELNYYSYFGPKTVTGTFGTAILSRYPIRKSKSIFSYSTTDEVATVVAEITIDGKDITIVNSHPAGNHKAKISHLDVLSTIAQQSNFVIALGDYNFTQSSPYYTIITKYLKDSWLTIHPDGILKIDDFVRTNPLFRDIKSGLTEIDMKNRIDHIFLSSNIKVLESWYLLEPHSQTDHPAYWITISLD